MTTYSWLGMSANWRSVLFWAVDGAPNGSFPGTNDVAIIAAPGTYAIGASGVYAQSLLISDPNATLNTGFLTIGSGGLNNAGTLAIGASGSVVVGTASGSGSFANTGTITLGSGARLTLYANISTSALAQVQSTGGMVALQGTLDNTGATLTAAPFGALQLQGVVIGGTIAGSSGTLITNGLAAPFFRDVTILGNLTLNGILDAASSLQPSAPGGTGTLTVTSALVDLIPGVIDNEVLLLSQSSLTLVGTLGAQSTITAPSGFATISLPANLGLIAAAGSNLMLTSDLANSGTVALTNGYGTAAGTITGSGTIVVSAAARFELQKSYGQQVLTFLDTTGLIKLDVPGGAAATTVQGFGPGATIELAATPAPTLTVAGTSTAGSTLVASNGSLTLATFVLPSLAANATLVGSIDGAGDTFITAKFNGSAGTYTWSPVGASADWTAPSNWYGNSGFSTPGAQVAAPGRDRAFFTAGTLAYTPTLLNNVELSIGGASTIDPEVDFGNVELGAAVLIDVASGYANPGEILKFSGQATLDAGAIIAAGTSDLYHELYGGYGLTIELASDPANPSAPPSFTNHGSISANQITVLNVGGAAGTFVNSGTLVQFNPNLVETLAPAITGTGTIVTAMGGKLKMLGAVGAGQTILVNDGAFGTGYLASLEIAAPAQFAGQVQILNQGTVQLDGIVASKAGYAGGVLTLSNGLTLRVSGAFQPTVTNNGTDTFVTACFAAGTRIATACGAVPVETLQEGDQVRLADGGTAPVVWLGHSRVACARHPRPHDVWPIRVRADAFGAGSPERDLRLSPDHAIYVDGVLIPIRYLVNGTTITQQRPRTVTYFHVELPEHAVILAEGLACESYLDTGNRSAFINGGVVRALHPDLVRSVWSEQACADLVLDGPRVIGVQQRLLARAIAAGHALTDDADLQVLADGRPLPATIEGGFWQVVLPPGTRGVRLVSRSWVPADTRPGETDTRCLGVAIGRIFLHGREMALDSPALAAGWHRCEPDMRWTDGDAAFSLDGVRHLAFTVAMTGTYWQPHRTRRALRA